MPKLYSIGHSSHALDHLLLLLREHQIEVVVDVRSTPYSHYSPQFAGPALERALRSIRIRYLHMPQLGGRPLDRTFYDEAGHVLYQRVAASETFTQGLNRLLEGAAKYEMAVLCSEEDPIACHRWRLIGRAVEEHGSPMLHIRGDGRTETHRGVLLRDEAEHPEAYQLRLLEAGEDQWRSTKPVRTR
ncbi:MAG: DUF488 domain-containing protein [Candidatus Limnocylindria bacterium]